MRKRPATSKGKKTRKTRKTGNGADDVLVVFEGGDLNRPLVLGTFWNGSQAPPTSPNSPKRPWPKTTKRRRGSSRLGALPNEKIPPA